MWQLLENCQPEAEKDVLITYIDKFSNRQVTIAQYFPEGYVVDFLPYGEEWDREDVQKFFTYNEEEDTWTFNQEQWLYTNMGCDECMGCYIDGEVIAWMNLPEAYKD